MAEFGLLGAEFELVNEPSEDSVPLASLTKEMVEGAKAPHRFINLHHHDEYSLRDGLGTVDQLVKVLGARGQKYCCITNHGHLGGWVKQYFACKKAGIFPIFGVEAYTSEIRKEDAISGEAERKKQEAEALRVELSELKKVKFEKDKAPKKKDFQFETDYQEARKKYEESRDKYAADVEAHKNKCAEIYQRMMGLFEEAKAIDEAEKEKLKESRKSNHLILLARNQEGFRNLIHMNNDAVLNGFYGKPRMNREAMKKWGKGIIACTACYAGELPQYLLNGEQEKAEEFYNFLKECFDDVYVEMTMVEWEEQIGLCDKLIEFARKVGGKLTVSLDSHYINQEDQETQRLLLLMANGQTVNDNPDKTWTFSAKNLYCRDYDDLSRMFDEGFGQNHEFSFKNEIFTRGVFEEACRNTRKLVSTIEEIKLDDSVKLPKMSEDGDEELAKRAKAGLEKRFDEIRKNAKRNGKEVDEKEYWGRLEYELDVIYKMGFADYFLIVQEIIKMAIERFGVDAVGIGRGSGVGSLVNYCLEITDLDPIEHNLLFERFLDEGRAGVLACTFEV